MEKVQRNQQARRCWIRRSLYRPGDVHSLYALQLQPEYLADNGMHGAVFRSPRAGAECGLVRYIPAAEMATLTLISAVLAPVWAFAFFNEQPPLTTMAGGAVILVSIFSYVLSTSTKQIHPKMRQPCLLKSRPPGDWRRCRSIKTGGAASRPPPGGNGLLDLRFKHTINPKHSSLLKKVQEQGVRKTQGRRVFSDTRGFEFFETTKLLGLFQQTKG